MVWLCTDYADLRVHIFGDEEAYKMIGNEFNMIISSHRGDLDWMAGLILGAHYGFLHVRCDTRSAYAGMIESYAMRCFFLS